MFSAGITLLFALAFAIAFLTFFWGLVTYFWNVAVNEEGRRHGKSILLAGVTAIFVLMVLYGAIEWIGNMLGIEIFRTY